MTASHPLLLPTHYESKTVLGVTYHTYYHHSRPLYTTFLDRFNAQVQIIPPTRIPIVLFDMESYLDSCDDDDL